MRGLIRVLRRWHRVMPKRAADPEEGTGVVVMAGFALVFVIGIGLPFLGGSESMKECGMTKETLCKVCRKHEKNKHD